MLETYIWILYVLIGENHMESVTLVYVVLYNMKFNLYLKNIYIYFANKSLINYGVEKKINIGLNTIE